MKVEKIKSNKPNTLIILRRPRDFGNFSLEFKN